MGNILDFLARPDIGIEEFFLEYVKRKKAGSLYSADDYIPQNLIKLYYLDDNHIDFKQIIDEFKKNAVFNENEIERVSERLEKEGLALVYDDIENGRFSKIRNIYVLLLIHSVLYSATPYASLFGGKWRKTNAYITDTDVKTADYNNIAIEVQKLNDLYCEILNMASIINDVHSPDLLIKYIDKCLYLKCKLVRIHPFADGNKRSCRALVNLLFKEVSLPPVYVTKEERNEYLKVLKLALEEEDYTHLNKFYYYKICDSIYELDISKRDTKNKTM